jgi:hypothetical protein
MKEIEIGELTIIEGKYIIYIDDVYDDTKGTVKYLDKKYDEGWEIVSQGGSEGIDSLILHKTKGDTSIKG